MTDPTPTTEAQLSLNNSHNSPTLAAPLAPESLPSPPPTPAKLTKAAAKRHKVLSRLLARGDSALTDPEFVHDIRVASRRLGEVARLLKSFIDKPAAKAVDASLKSLRRSMGDLRDSDVTCEHLLKWRMPTPVKQIARELAQALQTNRPQLVQVAAQQMTSASVTGAMVILARILEDHTHPEAAAQTETHLAQVVASQLKKRDKQLRRAFGKAARKQTPESLHAARIIAKKLRYILELSEDADTPGAQQKVRTLKQIQEILGDHHDVHVIVEQIQTHLKDRREKPLKNLPAAWRKWHRETELTQSQRAAAFFTKTYAWINA